MNFTSLGQPPTVLTHRLQCITFGIVQYSSHLYEWLRTELEQSKFFINKKHPTDLINLK